MNLYTPLMKRVSFGKVSFRLHTSFRTVLQCYAVFEDDLLTDYEKVDVCLTLLVRRKFLLRFFSPDQKLALFYQIFQQFLEIPGKKTKPGQKQFDFTQDAASIYSSFWQCYHIDLIGRDRNLHWWSFVALFNGLSDDTKMMQILSIRSRPLPKPTQYNQEERRQLMRLKQLYRLEVSEEERKEQFQNGLANMAAMLTQWAKRTNE